MKAKALLPALLVLISVFTWVLFAQKDESLSSTTVPPIKPGHEKPLPSSPASVLAEETKRATMKRAPKDVRYGPTKVSASKTTDKPRPHTQPCDARSDPLRETPAGGIVKWTDENGITHYENFHGEDQPDGKDLVVRSPHTKDYFSLDIRFPPKRQLPFSTEDIQRKATSVYEIYRKWLNDRWLSRAEIRLRFFADQKKYAAYRDTFVTQGSNYIAGFYLAQKNQAVILHQGSKDATFRVMVHEIAHIINHQVFGELPRWLNEGLATHIEYLERDGSKSGLSDKQLKNLKSYTKSQVLSALSVADLLATSHRDWTSENLATYYQLSQTLVHFMLLPENRESMLPILKVLAERKCRDKDLNGIIEEYYSGGVSALAEGFGRWLEG